MIKMTIRLEERINARWLKWAPWVLMAARKNLPNVDTDVMLHSARQVHQARYIEAMQCHISEYVIRQRNMDDPRMNIDQFRIKVETTLRRRVSHMGGKTPKQIREEIQCSLKR